MPIPFSHFFRFPDGSPAFKVESGEERPIKEEKAMNGQEVGYRPESPVLEVACLLLAYRWEQAELERCGVREVEFQLMLSKLRLAVLMAGWVEA